MSRRALPILLLAFSSTASPAHAAKSPKKAIWGPVEIDGESQFPVYKDLGAGVFQMTLKWDEVGTVAPEDATDPEDTAYDWPAEIDTAIDEGKRNGIKIALTVAGTPGWANGERRGPSRRPRPPTSPDFLDRRGGALQGRAHLGDRRRQGLARRAGTRSCSTAPTRRCTRPTSRTR